MEIQIYANKLCKSAETTTAAEQLRKSCGE